MPSGIGSKRAQHLPRLANLKGRKRETQAQADSEVTMLPLSLLQRVDMGDYDRDSAGTGTQNAATHRDSDASSSSGDLDPGSSDPDIGMTDTEDSEDSGLDNGFQPKCV